MREEILLNIDRPEVLERLYRQNKRGFTHDFVQVYPEIRDQVIARVWMERLSGVGDEHTWGERGETLRIFMASILAFLIAKIPEIFGIDEEFFYTRNISFIVFPILGAYFAWKQKIAAWRLGLVGLMLSISVIYVNILPPLRTSDTLTLAFFHLILFVWSLVGFIYVGDSDRPLQKRLEFLRYNGDLLVMGTIIFIAGMILTAITVGLFKLIALNIEEFYFRYIGIFGLAAAPLLATYLVQVNPQLVGRVSPVIARIFTPFVLIMLISYLVAVLYTGKNPYTDREFLLIFNLLLAGVLAIILFSVADGIQRQTRNKTEVSLLLALSLVTILVNGIALSAIVFRINEWGITPNRLAVLGSNILILTNLILVAWRLLYSLKTNCNTELVGKTIAWFLPIYTAWAAFVTFTFPVIFGYK